MDNVVESNENKLVLELEVAIGPPPNTFPEHHMTPREIVASLLQTKRRNLHEMLITHGCIIVFYYWNRRDDDDCPHFKHEMLAMLRSGLPDGWEVDKTPWPCDDAVYLFRQTKPDAMYGQKYKECNGGWIEDI